MIAYLERHRLVLGGILGVLEFAGMYPMTGSLKAAAGIAAGCMVGVFLIPHYRG